MRELTVTPVPAAESWDCQGCEEGKVIAYVGGMPDGEGGIDERTWGYCPKCLTRTVLVGVEDILTDAESARCREQQSLVTERNMKPAEVAEWWAENGEHDYLGATRCYPQDRYPLLVTSASKSGKTITYVTLRSVGGDTGHKPARFDGPFPVWDHDYTQDDMRDMSDYSNPDINRTARWSEKRGCYQDGGTPIKVGVANLYRNYSY